MSTHHKIRKRYEIAQQARFLTCSCFQRLPLFDNDAIKQAFVEELRRSRERTHFQLVAWVIMPEHVHLVIVPELPEFPVSKALSDLKGQFAGRVLRRWRELGAPVLARLVDGMGKQRFWQVGGGYDRNVYRDAELIEKVQYMHSNPQARGLVSDALNWPWSSARWYAGLRGNAPIDIDQSAW